MKNNLLLSSYNWKNSSFFNDMKLSKEAIKNLGLNREEYIMNKIIAFEDRFTKVDINAKVTVDRMGIIAL